MNTQVEIVVNGKPVKVYNHQGKSYIEAKVGTEYSIKIKNNGHTRKLAIITVDGLNVITGQPQGFDVSNGYVISAYNVLDVKGFRKDMESVGAFKFCNKDQSYCNENGLEGNNGIIGIRVYEEKTYFRNSDVNIEYYKTYGSSDFRFSTKRLNDSIESSTTCSTLESSSRGFDVGTTWGKEVSDKVINVDFDADLSKMEEFLFYYDSRKNLESIGISFQEVKQVVFPQAFGNFAKPPKNWKNN